MPFCHISITRDDDKYIRQGNITDLRQYRAHTYPRFMTLLHNQSCTGVDRNCGGSQPLRAKRPTLLPQKEVGAEAASVSGISGILTDLSFPLYVLLLDIFSSLLPNCFRQRSAPPALTASLLQLHALSPPSSSVCFYFTPFVFSFLSHSHAPVNAHTLPLPLVHIMSHYKCY